MSRPAIAPVDSRFNSGGAAVKLANQRPARSRVTRADVADSISFHALVAWNPTHPNFGTWTLPHLWLMRLTERSLMANPSLTPFLRQVGRPKWLGFFHQFLNARSKSRKACLLDR